MGKHEAPAFKMVIEGGKLVPATAYDAERLDTYRRGTTVNVTFVRDGSRVMEKKWWAVLNRAVKECPTPWKTASEASEAIKLAIGIVNLTKTVGGQFLAYPKSLTELTDPELDEAVVQMLGVIQGVTGVDPDDWKKEIADVGEDEPSPANAPAGDAGSGEELSSQPAAEEAGAIEAGDDPAAVPASEPSDWLKPFAKAIVAAIQVDEEFVVNTSRGLFVEGLSDDTRERAKAIIKYARQLCRGEIERADALEIIAGKAGAEVGEITA